MVVSVVFVVTLEAEIEDLMPDLMKLTRAAAEAARKTETSTAGGFTRTARELERRRQTVTDQLKADPVLRSSSTCRAPDLDPISLAGEPPWLKSSQSKIRSATRLIRALLHRGTHRAKFARSLPRRLARGADTVRGAPWRHAGSGGAHLGAPPCMNVFLAQKDKMVTLIDELLGHLREHWSVLDRQAPLVMQRRARHRQQAASSSQTDSPRVRIGNLGPSYTRAYHFFG